MDKNVSKTRQAQKPNSYLIIPEVLIDKKTGFPVPPKDSTALAESVINLLQNKELMKKMGKASLDRFENKFTKDIMIRNVETLYEILFKK